MTTSRHHGPALAGRTCALLALVALLLEAATGAAVGADAAAPARVPADFARSSAPAGSAPLEEVASVPVQVRPPDVAPLQRNVVVTIVRGARRAPTPWLLLLHGRPADPAERARMGRVDYPANARYLAALGFTVFIPTRVGYGATGGPDLENTGECATKRFDPGIAAALDEVRQIAAFARAQRYVAPQRGLIVGESFGGLIAIAAAASPPPGLRGVVDFAGGDGGDSSRHPDEPCRADLLEDWFASRGRTARLPALWLYSANDRLWGRAAPQRWWSAFRSSGGVGEFLVLPPDKNNGHFIFVRNPPAWRADFERFVLGLDLPGRTGGG